MTRHGRSCADDECPACQNRAEERAADRDEPMSAGESQGRENSYEAAMWGGR